MRQEEREVSTKIDGTEYKRKYQALFPAKFEDILQLFSKEDALAVFNARLEVVQDNRARLELANEHKPEKPKKTTRRISYEKLYSSKPKEVPVDTEHLQKILKENSKK